jgi:hypothetical protein
MAAIERLVPVWQKIVDQYHDQWFDPKVSSVKLTMQILGDMRDSMDQIAGSDYDLRGKLSAWFGNMTRERIANSREWSKAPPTPGNSQ